MKISPDIKYPFKFELTDDGRRKRIFDESEAGINVSVSLTLPEARAFLNEFSSEVAILEDFIVKYKEEKKD